MITLGPFVFGGALFLINFVMHGLSLINIPLLGPLLNWLLPFVLSMGAFAALYVFVPNRKVLWKDALVGGFVAAVIFLLLS